MKNVRHSGCTVKRSVHDDDATIAAGGARTQGQAVAGAAALKEPDEGARREQEQQDAAEAAIAAALRHHRRAVAVPAGATGTTAQSCRSSGRFCSGPVGLSREVPHQRRCTAEAECMCTWSRTKGLGRLNDQASGQTDTSSVASIAD